MKTKTEEKYSTNLFVLAELPILLWHTDLHVAVILVLICKLCIGLKRSNKRQFKITNKKSFLFSNENSDKIMFWFHQSWFYWKRWGLQRQHPGASGGCGLNLCLTWNDLCLTWDEPLDKRLWLDWYISLFIASEKQPVWGNIRKGSLTLIVNKQYHFNRK